MEEKMPNGNDMAVIDMEDDDERWKPFIGNKIKSIRR